MSREPCCQAEYDGEPCTCKPMVQFTEAKHPINITVYRFSCGDGEGQQYWDEPETYIQKFPVSLQPAIRYVSDPSNDVATWDQEEIIRLLLLPHIEHRELYESDQAKWQHDLLEGELI